MEDIEAELARHIANQHVDLAALLTSVKGVGNNTTAATLIADVPELGKLSRREISALIGVAPLARDSGLSRGKRTTFGGRAEVRCTLYMATLVATRHNPVIKRFYGRLAAQPTTTRKHLLLCSQKQMPIMPVTAFGVPLASLTRLLAYFHPETFTLIGDKGDRLDATPQMRDFVFRSVRCIRRRCDRYKDTIMLMIEEPPRCFGGFSQILYTMVYLFESGSGYLVGCA
ncbi:MAG: transposase [Gammaproteobacteria bacterium]